MHCKTILVCVAICLFSIPHVASFGPITITLGTTALALSGTQVALGVAALAGLVIVKEKIAVAEISRQRGKREVLSDNINALYETLYQTDGSDCGKLLVCLTFEKPIDTLNEKELGINKLFADDLSVIDPTTRKSDYQLAAYVGAFNQTGLCSRRYSRCLVTPEELQNLL